MELFLFVLLAIYISICIGRSIFKYRVYGLTFNLLIGLEIGVVAVIIVIALAAKIITILNSSEQTNGSEGDSLQLYLHIRLVFEIITQCSANTVHWVFAMKYWGVARKLSLLEANQDVEKFNLKFSLIFWIGFAFNFTAGLLFIGVLFVKQKWFYYTVTGMQACIFVSCGFLIDAFRILSKQKADH